MSWFERFKRASSAKKGLSQGADASQESQDIAKILDICDLNTFVIALNDWLNRKCRYGNQLTALTPEEKTIYIVDTFQSEVNNGGFLQYLYNDSGATVNELLAALSVIGAKRTVKIYQKALSHLPVTLPADSEQRGTMLDNIVDDTISDIFSSCDKQFYDYDNSENLDALIYQYAMNHREAFN